jgi:bifunctional non-homologous end joining protein LigD
MPRGSKRPRTSDTSPSASLEAYRDKRDFAKTAEPPPEGQPVLAGPLTFVVQKHAARRLHYDFRLELDGVLKSWSVPKGPSLDPKEKRLAVMVEDHPVSYATFEGVIAPGQYGAGEVIVWDNGTYSPDESGELSFHDRAEAERRLRRELADGKVSVLLRGRKLKGSWTLVKMQRGENDWLLIKHQDPFADPERDITEEDRSVFTNRTLEDVAAGRSSGPGLPRIRGGPAGLPGAREAPLPDKLLPMLATPAGKPFSHPQWLFEAKLDGVRTIVLLRDGDVRLRSRRGLDVTKQYPALVEELARQPACELALDGEIVAFDDEGRPSFEQIQQRLNLTRDADIRRAESEVPAYFYAFDLLHVDGYGLRGATLEHRRALLERVLAPTEHVRLLEAFEAEGETAYDAATRLGFEGVLAKRRDSTYAPGQRSQQWLKIKSTKTDEFVVGGYTEGQGARAKTFGALLLGQYEDGRLVYCGHVGSGFDDRTLAALRERLDALRTGERPFAEQPPLKGTTTWVRPELVAEVKFAQRTREGYLRAPVFLHLREDKPARDIQRIEAAAPPEVAGGAAGGPAADEATAEDIDALVEQIERAKEKALLDVQGHKIGVTNLDKIFWPKAGRRRALTKRDLLRYFARVSPYLVPHLRDRPLTLTRYPNGIDGEFFFQKHVDAPLPEFVETVDLYSGSNEADQQYIMCNNLPTLIWLGQLADLELHTWYSRVDPEPDGHGLPAMFTGSEENIRASLLNYPDFIVLDLDPYIYSGKENKGDEPELNRKAFAKTCEVAGWLKEILDSLSLTSFIKTSGKTGLHIYVPVLRKLDYGAARAAAETIGHYLLQQHPRDVTMEWAVEKRAGKVFYDHNQNVRGKTLASVYSPRPHPHAPVSMPLRWEELGQVYPTDFTILNAPERLARAGDLWANILEAKNDLAGMLA